MPEPIPRTKKEKAAEEAELEKKRKDFDVMDEEIQQTMKKNNNVNNTVGITNFYLDPEGKKGGKRKTKKMRNRRKMQKKHIRYGISSADSCIESRKNSVTKWRRFSSKRTNKK